MRTYIVRLFVPHVYDIQAKDDAELLEKIGEFYKEFYKKDFRELIEPLVQPEEVK